jgi:uncharacterized membrane protein
MSPSPAPDAAELPGPGPEAEATFAALVEAANAREAAARASRGIWLSHHHPEDHERCLVVRGRLVCRRCFVLYPLGFSVALLTLAGGGLWPTSLDPLLIWLLCIPATVDFVGEQLGWFRYAARRQAVVTAVVAVAYGRGLGLELDDRWHPLFWGPILVFGTTWFVVSLVGRRRRQRRQMPSAPAISSP